MTSRAYDVTRSNINHTRRLCGWKALTWEQFRRRGHDGMRGDEETAFVAEIDDAQTHGDHAE